MMFMLLKFLGRIQSYGENNDNEGLTIGFERKQS